MSNMHQRLYKKRAALNVLAGGIENAEEVFAASSAFA